MLLLAEAWKKKQKAKEETAKTMLDKLSQITQKNDRFARTEQMFDSAKQTRNKQRKILADFKQRIKSNKKPDEHIEYKGCNIKIYNLSENTRVYRIVDWDNRTRDAKYFTLEEAKQAIQSLYPFSLTKEAYLAEKERVLRKKEQDYFLAKAYKQRQQRTKFQKNLRTIDDLFNLTPVEFEQWVKNNIFMKEGWIVEETKITGDGGIDLMLHKNGEHSIAQCKRFKSSVGEPLLRDFYGAMMSEGVSRGYFVTTGVFSLQAQKFADNKPIVLIDRRVLAQRLVS